MGDAIKTGIRCLKSGCEGLRQNYGPAASRTLHLAAISGLGSILLGLGKIISGLLSLSVFACVNGCYTLGMVLALYCALAGALRTKNPKGQHRYCRWSGMILIAASLLYILYSVYSYLHPKPVSYHMYIALAIATLTFAEIGLNLRGVLVSQKNHAPALHAIKTIHLAASLISLVLTQAAILSFAQETPSPAANGILGALMGGCAALLGAYLLRRIRRLEDGGDCRAESRRLGRLCRRLHLQSTISPVGKEMLEDGSLRVTVQIAPPLPAKEWALLQAQARGRMALALIPQTK